MIREAHILHGVLCLIVQENLLSADISFLVTDIMRIGEAVQGFLEESLHAYFESQKAVESTSETQNPASVLLLSGDRELSQLREYALRKAGYAVTRASSRSDALRLLGQNFDALVVAYSLAQENIQEFAEHFRIANPSAPIVGVVKGVWQDLKVELDASVSGDDGPEAMLEALSSALKRRSLRLIK